MQYGQFNAVSSDRKVTGTGSAAIKYDILTALLVTSARGDAVDARLALRLSLLITARFNWRTGLFNVGQREMARMWGVTERTAKREMAAMRARRWITVATPAARGRVASYRINLDQVLEATMPHWDAVGPDFVARMTGGAEPQEAEASKIVPLRRPRAELPQEDGTCWPHVAARLHAQDPAVFAAWFTPLVAVSSEAGVLTLMAPSRFQADYVRTHFHARIQAACIAEGSGVREVEIIST